MSRQNPARTLQEAQAGMSWEVLGGRFALLGWDVVAEDLDPGLPEPDLLGSGPAQVVVEGGEITLLAPQEIALAWQDRHPRCRVERDLRWIRFRTPMGWEVVGFLARVTSALAQAGVPLGAVCGFSRDHLFVAERHLAQARQVLADLFGPERKEPPPARTGAGGGCGADDSTTGS